MKTTLYIIVGVSSTLGKQVASRLLSKDKFVIGTYYKNKTALNNFSKMNNFSSFRLNLLNQKELYSFVKGYLINIILERKIEQITMIYTSGSWFQGRIGSWNYDDFNKVFDVNVKAPLSMISMLLSDYDSSFNLILISGLSGEDNAVKGNLLYGLSTNALKYAVNVLSQELSERVNSNCILIELGLFNKGQVYYEELLRSININQVFSFRHVADFILNIILNPSRMSLINGSNIKIKNNISNYSDIITWFENTN